MARLIEVRLIEKSVKYTAAAIVTDFAFDSRNVTLSKVEVDGQRVADLDINQLDYTEFSRIRVLLISEVYRLYPEAIPR